MKLLITGVSHKTAPVDVRERLAFSDSALPAALAQLKSREGVSEALILSTCNRVETVAMGDDGADLRALICEFLVETHQASAASLGPCLYHHEGPEAILHLFRVAASLDSMVVGEPQILGQLKAAFAVAKAQGALCGLLETVLSRAFSLPKPTRAKPRIGQLTLS